MPLCSNILILAFCVNVAVYSFLLYQFRFCGGDGLNNFCTFCRCYSAQSNQFNSYIAWTFCSIFVHPVRWYSSNEILHGACTNLLYLILGFFLSLNRTAVDFCLSLCHLVWNAAWIWKSVNRVECFSSSSRAALARCYLSSFNAEQFENFQAVQVARCLWSLDEIIIVVITCLAD